MLQKFLNKIESNRKSKNIILRCVINVKDYLWQKFFDNGFVFNVIHPRRGLRHLLNNKKGKRQKCDSVAIIFVGTGRYIEFFENYYKKSKELFLPATSKKYFVFTDQDTNPSLLNRLDVTVVKTDRPAWPLPALYKFKYIMSIRDSLIRFSHIVYIDADMVVNKIITEDEFFLHDKPLFGVEHPGLVGKIGTFETNHNSLACVSRLDDLSTYWQSCFWGGKTKDVLVMCEELERRTDDDLVRGVIAKWWDESHVNKYYIENKDDVYTYNPEYAYPELANLPSNYKKKIIHLDKNNNKMRGLN